MSREAEARAYYQLSVVKAKKAKHNPKQQFPKGSRVHISKDMPSFMFHFDHDKDATVMYSYKQAYGCGDYNEYCLDIDGIGEVSWYPASLLTLIED